MQARVDWVLIIFGTQVIKKKQLVRPVFPNYLSVSYDYVVIYLFNHDSSKSTIFMLNMAFDVLLSAVFVKYSKLESFVS